MGSGIPNTWLFLTPYLGSRDTAHVLGAVRMRMRTAPKTLYNEVTIKLISKLLLICGSSVNYP